jgi:hypothetical protein
LVDYYLHRRKPVTLREPLEFLFPPNNLVESAGVIRTTLISSFRRGIESMKKTCFGLTLAMILLPNCLLGATPRNFTRVFMGKSETIAKRNEVEENWNRQYKRSEPSESESARAFSGSRRGESSELWPSRDSQTNEKSRRYTLPLRSEAAP